MTDKPESFDNDLAEAILDKYGTADMTVTEVNEALDWAKWAREWLLKDACTNSRGGLIGRARKDLIEENAELKAELAEICRDIIEVSKIGNPNKFEAKLYVTKQLAESLLAKYPREKE